MTLQRHQFAAVLVAAGLLALAGTGCRQQMANQPRYDEYEPSELFRDGASARPLPEGTIARGHLRADALTWTGMTRTGGKEEPADEFPMALTAEVLARGRDRFAIACVPCHGLGGYGDGKIVERGFAPPPSFHIDRLRQAPVGHFFDVMTRGYGAMPDYAAEVAVPDRWAIAAHIRVLQLSQHFPAEGLTPADRERLSAAQPPAAPAGKEAP